MIRLPTILAFALLFFCLTLVGCGGWWRVDQSTYQPSPEITQEVSQNAPWAPVGVSKGPPPQEPGKEQGEPSFQPPHPAKEAEPKGP